jgi:hypothetical protein
MAPALGQSASAMRPTERVRPRPIHPHIVGGAAGDRFSKLAKGSTFLDLMQALPQGGRESDWGPALARGASRECVRHHSARLVILVAGNAQKHWLGTPRQAAAPHSSANKGVANTDLSIDLVPEPGAGPLAVLACAIVAIVGRRKRASGGAPEGLNRADPVPG